MGTGLQDQVPASGGHGQPLRQKTGGAILDVIDVGQSGHDAASSRSGQGEVLAKGFGQVIDPARVGGIEHQGNRLVDLGLWQSVIETAGRTIDQPVEPARPQNFADQAGVGLHGIKGPAVVVGGQAGAVVDHAKVALQQVGVTLGRCPGCRAFCGKTLRQTTPDKPPRAHDRDAHAPRSPMRRAGTPPKIA